MAKVAANHRRQKLIKAVKLTKARWAGYKTTPAMCAGITNRIWTHRDIAALLD